MTNKFGSQHGMALVQVMLITAVLMILALFLTQTAKEQVKLAQWADDKSSAYVALHGAESKLLFSLLTEPKVGETNQLNTVGKDISSRWNFFSMPFTLNEQVEVTIQDQSALIHAHFPNVNHLKALFIHKGLSSTQASAVVDNLLDWQDLDSIPRNNGFESNGSIELIRNGAIPDPHDFAFVKGIDEELLRTLLDNTTLYGKGFFNPMNASLELLSAITNRDAAQQVISMRERGQLTSTIFTQLTGIAENNKILLYPSNTMKISLISEVGESVVRSTKIVELNPYASEYQLPLNIVSNSG